MAQRRGKASHDIWKKHKFLLKAPLCFSQKFEKFLKNWKFIKIEKFPKFWKISQKLKNSLKIEKFDKNSKKFVYYNENMNPNSKFKRNFLENYTHSEARNKNQ